jgi:outer membrane lipoprotein SlyB
MSGRLRNNHNDRGRVWRRAVFTFTRAAIAPLPAALALALSACAPTVRSSPTASMSGSPSGPTGPAYGTIAAVRAVIPMAGTAGDNPEFQILTAMGVAAPGAAAGSEIVVQTDDGQALSVVQANPAGLAPGERVEIVPGAIPRLEPLGGAAPRAKS